MNSTDPSKPPVIPSDLSYFVVRLECPPGVAHTDIIGGVVEHLGAGEKRRFESGAELLGLMTRWAQRQTKMEQGAAGDNADRGVGSGPEVRGQAS